jgi:RNA polymerase sigma-70 factor (ECF subfamily)
MPSVLTPPTDPATWVDRHGDALFRFAVTRLRDRELAEDVVQETFLAALKARDRFTGASSERTWLVAILKNKVVDRIRKAGRERPAQDIAADDEITADLFERGYWRTRPRAWPREAESREFREALDGCLQSLPDRLGLAFRLREADGLETEEICNILDVTATNLATLLYRARARLRRCLETTWGETDR